MVSIDTIYDAPAVLYLRDEMAKNKGADCLLDCCKRYDLDQVRQTPLSIHQPHHCYCY